MVCVTLALDDEASKEESVCRDVKTQFKSDIIVNMETCDDEYEKKKQFVQIKTATQFCLNLIENAVWNVFCYMRNVLRMRNDFINLE